MLLERYLAEALTSSFGHVVDGLDQNKIRLSVWRGELAFQDLSIKSDAIPSDFVEIAYGRIGQLHVKFPWQLVRQQLWRRRTADALLADGLSAVPRLQFQVVLTGVNVLVTPKRRPASMECDETECQESMEGATSSQRAQHWVDREAEIQKGIDAFLLQRRFDLQQQQSGKSWKESLRKQLVNALLSNLVVSVENIHIRFEDAGRSVRLDFGHIPDTTASRFRPPFAVGFLLKHFTVQSFDKKPEEQNSQIPSQQSGGDTSSLLSASALLKHRTLNRSVRAEALAAYWDSDCRNLMVEQANEAMYQLLFEQLNSSSVTARHSFVLGPFSPSMEVSLADLASDVDISGSENASDAESPLKSRQDRTHGARTGDVLGIASTSQVLVSLPPCHLCLSRNLLEDLGYLRLSYCMSRSSRQHVSRLVMKLRRPTSTPKDDPRRWWQYAIKAVQALQKSLEPVGWARLAQAISRRARYISLYKALLLETDHPDNKRSRVRSHLSLLDMERSLLKVDEVVAFRLAAYQNLHRLLLEGEATAKYQTLHQLLLEGEATAKSSTCDHKDTLADDDDVGIPDSTVDIDVPVALKGESILSLEHRLNMFTEMTRAMYGGDSSRASHASDTADARKRLPSTNNDVALDAYMSCSEFSLQVNDRRSHGFRETSTSDGVAVARLSCAFVIHHKLFRDGSWHLSNQLGSLQIQDCTVSETQAAVPFPNLLCNKSTSQAKTMELNGYSLYESVSVAVSRTYSPDGPQGYVATTTTRIRVLPMEITYATAPVEALSRILSTANIELTDDYYRVVSKLHEWRERQRVRLVRALAHKKKKIFLDVEIGAPVILVPEESSVDSSLLIVDLGRILFHNGDRTLTGKHCEYDDTWCLCVKQVQVQCSRTYLYRQILHDEQEPDSLSSALPLHSQQLVEPFSLEFSIGTKFESEGDGRHRQTSVNVLASLPRLALNVTSSALRLTERLQIQWQKRKGLHQPAFIPRATRATAPTIGSEPSQSDRKIRFHFVAPLLRIRVENDVDGRDCNAADNGSMRGTTPLLDLAVKGIEGRLLSESQPHGVSSLSWTARLRSLYAFDLYQGAGDAFSFFLSSVCPDLLLGRTPKDILSLDAKSPSTDLVSFEFESLSRSTGTTESDKLRESKLFVIFNELYVEWNPETIAALQVAMKLPITVLPEEYPSLDEESYFDAEEEEYFDALSSGSADELPLVNASICSAAPVVAVSSTVVRDRRPSSIHFELSKLRVNLNKETRHRRLLIVEMDSTQIHRCVETSGRSRTRATLGNLTVSDADYSFNKTLYREILGLKTDSPDQTGTQSSLLDMEIFVNPKSRTLSDGITIDLDGEVVVDVAAQTASGYDTFIKARFSPMRFVYLQQVWFELVDYFFEGVVGYEVWGNQRPTFGPMQDVTHDPPNADRINFTKFDVVLSSPVILFPVSYCSTDFLRVGGSSITLRNSYSYAAMRTEDEGARFSGRLQWFNSCSIEMKDLVVSHSCGREFCAGQENLSAFLSLNWPSGPTAPLNAPKWKVDCNVDEIFLSLHQEDYALIQHIVQFNLGEESRHLDEWHALQNLPPLVLKRYKEDIMVHFGYDKKDVAPTTFDVEVTLPVLRFRFLLGGKAVAIVCCQDFSWRYQKSRDLVTRQTVTCDLEIEDASGPGTLLLSSNHRKSLTERLLSDLTYTSTTLACGDITKTIQIVDSRVDVIYHSWNKLSHFFTGLPEPAFLSPDEVIQVGDRWYRIGSKTSRTVEASAQQYGWLTELGSGWQQPTRGQAKASSPTFRFYVTLRRPSISIRSESCALLLLADEASFSHFGLNSLIEREFKVVGVRIQVTRDDRTPVTNKRFLTAPWFFCGEIRRCSGSSPCNCSSHSVVISADKLEANLSFSDLTTFVETGLRLAHDINTNTGAVLQSDGPPTRSKSIDQSQLPKDASVSVRWDGIAVAVVDDSGRHFATSQEIILLSLGLLEFYREEHLLLDANDYGLKAPKPLSPVRYLTRLRFATLDITDSLQCSTSPFRAILTIRASYASLPEDFCELSADGEPPFAMELSSVFSASRDYMARIGSVEVQYNPSLVIAMQRFLGRTSKGMKAHLTAIFDLPAKATEAHRREIHQKEIVKGQLSLTHVRICLNKEHQGRQLIETVFTDGNVKFCKSQDALDVSGHLGIVDAFHNTSDGLVRNVLKVGGDNDANFLSFQYVNFQGHHPERPSTSLQLPEWVSSHLRENQTVDDYLSVSFASLDGVYDKELTMEIIDYLSNGMPGKGMGLTSIAAQGFVTKRIRTKSFLQIHVDSPRLLIPHDLLSESGIACSFADLDIKSWVSCDEMRSEPDRHLSVSIIGLQMTMHDSLKYENDDESPICAGIDVSIEVRKNSNKLVLRTSVSAIDITLRYREWVSFLSVLRLNLGRKLNRSRWDNLEVAWEKGRELENDSGKRDSLMDSPIVPTPRFSKDVPYSESARRVEFGKERSLDTGSKVQELDVTLSCDGVAVLLHRDDPVSTENGATSGHDLVLLVLRYPRCSMRRQSSGQQSTSISVAELYLFDLAGHRRIGRNGAFEVATPMSPFLALVEGYATDDTQQHFDSQIVFTVDHPDPSSPDVCVNILMNYISVAVLSRATEDLILFMTCKWDSGDSIGLRGVDKVSLEINDSLTTVKAQRTIQLKFVLHYPRFIFVADEDDKNSRALVLEGLAMMNATRITSPSPDTPNSLTIHADFQNISSYINPDAASLISVRKRHSEILKNVLFVDGIFEQADEGQSDHRLNPSFHGIPLLLPLTIGIEYEQKDVEGRATTRNLGIHLESLSTLVSSEDLSLINSVFSNLSRKTGKPSSGGRTYTYTATFHSERLGLGLRKEGTKIVVDFVSASARQKFIERGDVLQLVNGLPLTDASLAPLADVVNHLAALPRPLTVSFARMLDEDDKLNGPSHVEVPSPESERNAISGRFDSVDLTVNSATITFVDNEVTLLRANVRGVDAGCKVTVADSTSYRFKFSSGLEIDYYNIRLWCWEPLLESCSVSLTSELQDPRRGSREVSIEIGDLSQTPMCVNVSDAAVESLSRLATLTRTSHSNKQTEYDGTESIVDSSQKSVTSREAANAALLFAQRQVSDSAKPFVFRNKTGVSVAILLENDNKESRRLDSDLPRLGDYGGLQGFETSEIRVVANGEQAFFRVNGRSDTENGKRSRRFPPLTVAMQSIEGKVIDALQSLDVSRGCDSMTYPLSFSSSGNHVTCARHWLSWSVDHLDEQTILSLTTSFQVVSILTKRVEIGVSFIDKLSSDCATEKVKFVGTCFFGSTVFLPIWLATQRRPWQCFAKLPEHSLATLFIVDEDGKVKLESGSTFYVECRSDRQLPSTFLALSTEDIDHHFTVTIDCAVSIRNSLPSDCAWEITDSSLHFIAGSSSDSYGDEILPCGSRTEIFLCGFEGMQLRVRIPSISTWSSWVSLSMSTVQASLATEHVESPRTEVRETVIVDAFGVPLSLGVRLAEKQSGGLDVIVYAELWIYNCTSIPLVFGFTSQGSHSDLVRDPQSSFTEFSAAEAALKEISSLFDLGDDTLRPTRDVAFTGRTDVQLLPGQASSQIVEECFEYIEVEASTVLRRWWTTENPRAQQSNLTAVESDGTWRWLDESWRIDSSGRTAAGWESSARPDFFSSSREFNPDHRYRRRRWFRSRSGAPSAHLLEGVQGFYQPRFHGFGRIRESERGRDAERGNSESHFSLGMKVKDGMWSVTSLIPRHGTAYGVVRVSQARWPRSPHSLHHPTGLAPISVYELCYTVSPLNDLWGALSRSMLVSCRFLIRNDSKGFAFEVKQSGSDDKSAVSISPGEVLPFHWSNSSLPELVSVRPFVKMDGLPIYQWSGGLDPLTIGSLPLRIRQSTTKSLYSSKDANSQPHVRSIQAEAEIRPRTGGTGINISFREEEYTGVGALFRIENHSRFPLWFSQDGLLANHSSMEAGMDESVSGDLIRPSERLVFALDVPFRQGKYSGRRAATIAELLRVRLALFPLFSRAGIETTKVVSFTSAGERVRLNPSKLLFLDEHIRKSIRRVRVLGLVVNDGPTRVLRFCLMNKIDPENPFGNPFEDERGTSPHENVMQRKDFVDFVQEISDAAQEVSNLFMDERLPTEDEAVERAIFDISRSYAVEATEAPPNLERIHRTQRDTIVSFRAAFQGFVVSLIDSSPSEICLISLRNLNALGNWNTQRTTASTIYLTVTSLQVDNMLPNAPFPVAVCPYDSSREALRMSSNSRESGEEVSPPLLVVGLSFAPRHKTGIVCLRSATIAPRNLAIRVDLAFLVRLQNYVLNLQSHFEREMVINESGQWKRPDMSSSINSLDGTGSSAAGRQKFYFGGLTIMPCNIKLSVAPARALTSAQAALEGEVAAAIHQAVRKGDVKLGDSSALLGVRVGHINSTPLAVVRGVFKSIVVDAVLRLDGAQLNFAGVSLRHHISTTSQLSTHLGAHYLASLRQNVPALLGSLAVFGNPLGLVRGLGDGVSDFVLEPVKGFQRSVQEMDASYLVDGVARGTLSLARHTVGGFADSAALLTETFSKNMTVLTLDRRYAQKRDRKDVLREQEGLNVALGLGSGVQKLAQGFIEGVTGVVKAPLRGAEKKGFEGFAKGIGKGLLGLLVKPIIGISDGLTDVMIGVKGTVEGSYSTTQLVHPIRPRRALYGSDMRIRPYNVADAAAAALMMRTRLAGEHYLAHLDMGNRVALLSVHRILILGAHGGELEESLVLKFKHIESMEVRSIEQEDGSAGWGIIIILNTRRRNGSEVEVINCKDKAEAEELTRLIDQGMKLVTQATEYEAKTSTASVSRPHRGKSK